MTKVQIYTDGACIPNPGIGGYGIILIYNEHRKELSGGYSLTTSNRMELIAAIEGLKALKFSCEVKLYTDSQYLVNTMTKNWKRKANIDLWHELDELSKQNHVEFQWVKDDSGHPENERFDFLVGKAAKKANLPPDIGYRNLFCYLE
ncbi:MAG: RNase H family protein [Microcoleaceae cyanobacterium]